MWDKQRCFYSDVRVVNIAIGILPYNNTTLRGNRDILMPGLHWQIKNLSLFLSHYLFL